MMTSTANLARVRIRLFTAIGRRKAWVMCRATERRVRAYDQSIAGLAADVASGEVVLQDLDAETITMLRDFISHDED